MADTINFELYFQEAGRLSPSIRRIRKWQKIARQNRKTA